MPRRFELIGNIMVLHTSEELAEFTRSRNRSSSDRRRSPVNQAAMELRKQRTKSQRKRSIARKSDRRGKWEHDTWAVTEDDSNPIQVDLRIRSLQESLVEVARLSNGGYQPVDYIDGNQCRLDWQGGYFLVVNPATRVAALQRYDSRGGCESCNFGREWSEDGVNNELESALKDAVPCEEMYRRAKLCVDPKMHLRTMQAGDLGYDAVSALYASYLLFYEQTLAPMARQRCTEWKCRRWSKRCVRAVVKFQALWRGWHFRHRVLFSPHTDLGNWFLQHRWNRFRLEDSLSNQEQQLLPE